VQRVRERAHGAHDPLRHLGLAHGASPLPAALARALGLRAARNDRQEAILRQPRDGLLGDARRNRHARHRILGMHAQVREQLMRMILEQSPELAGALSRQSWLSRLTSRRR